MSDEPFYVRQTAEQMTEDEARRWFHEAAEEACQGGAKWARYTVHPDIKHLMIVEAWRERPDDEGEPRFALTHSQAGTSGANDQSREEQNQHLNGKEGA